MAEEAVNRPVRRPEGAYASLEGIACTNSNCDQPAGAWEQVIRQPLKCSNHPDHLQASDYTETWKCKGEKCRAEARLMTERICGRTIGAAFHISSRSFQAPANERQYHTEQDYYKKQKAKQDQIKNRHPNRFQASVQPQGSPPVHFLSLISSHCSLFLSVSVSPSPPLLVLCLSTSKTLPILHINGVDDEHDSR